jgi:hypothetical protein
MVSFASIRLIDADRIIQSARYDWGESQMLKRNTQVMGN